MSKTFHQQRHADVVTHEKALSITREMQIGGIARTPHGHYLGSHITILKAEDPEC